jgi:DNA repair exonuclease SbcCD ATPase subunit
MMSANSQPSLAWMDEELRRQKEMLSQLRDVVQSQSVLIEDQAGRIRDLQQRLTASHADTERIDRLEETLRQTRNEVSGLLEDLRKAQKRAEAQTEMVRQAERDSVTRFSQLSQDIDDLHRLEAPLESLGAEERRLHETSLKLQEALDGVTERVGSQEERTSLLDTEHRRTREEIARLTATLSELGEEQDQHTTRISFLEQWGDKGAKLVNDLQAFRAEMESDRDRRREEERQAELLRQKQIAEWARKMENLSLEIQTWSDQMGRFADQYATSRKLSQELRELAKQLRYEQEQMKQLQGIAEEQQRRELRQWQGENERRWNQHVELWQFRLEQQGKLDLEQTAKLEELATLIRDNREALDRLPPYIEECFVQINAESSRIWETLDKAAHALSDTVDDMKSQPPRESPRQPGESAKTD